MGYPTYGQQGYGQQANSAYYKRVKIETATPEALILMLYDGALRFMTQAEQAFEEKSIEKINNNLVRVQAIFTELQTSLDKSKGGEIATNLERLYIFFNSRLTEANMKKDIQPLLEIKPMVQNLRDTWEEAMQKHQSTQRMVPSGPRLNLSA